MTIIKNFTNFVNVSPRIDEASQSTKIQTKRLKIGDTVTVKGGKYKGILELLPTDYDGNKIAVIKIVGGEKNGDLLHFDLSDVSKIDALPKKDYLKDKYGVTDFQKSVFFTIAYMIEDTGKEIDTTQSDVEINLTVRILEKKGLLKIEDKTIFLTDLGKTEFDNLINFFLG